MLLALKNDGEIAAFTSKKIRSTVQPVILDWGRTHLRLAHEHSGFVEDSDDDDASGRLACCLHGMLSADHDLVAMTRFTTLNDPDMSPMLGFQGPFVSTVKMKTDDNARTATTRPDRRKPGENPLPPQSKCDALKKSFRIDDEKALLACLTACIDFIGHQIFKNIAKNWIKGICPRKQARFPYRDEKSRSQGKERRIPLWWPALEVCKFTEPDHIDKKGTSSHRSG